MNGLNRVYLMGRLGSVGEMKKSAKGREYVVLRIVTDHRRKNDAGEWTDHQEWHSVFAWGSLASTCARHLRTNAVVFVEGRLTYWKEDLQTKNSITADAISFHNVRHLDNEKESRNPDAVAHPA